MNSHHKYPLIVRDPKTTLLLKGKHLEVRYETAPPYFIGLVHVSEIYVHLNVPMSIQLAMKLARRVPLYFIDAHGNVTAELKSTTQS